MNALQKIILWALLLLAVVVNTAAFIDFRSDHLRDVLAGNTNVTGGSTYRLSSSIGTSNSTFTLSSFKEPVSNIKYTMSYLNSTIEYGTIDPSTSISEFVSFTGITQNSDGSATLTGVSRGLTRTPAGSSCTASSTLAQPHSGQATFILSDSPCLFAEIPFKANNETITGQWTFSSFPITPSNATSSETIAGIVQLATGAQASASTLLGSTGARLALPASIASSTYNRLSAPNLLVMTKATGAIDLRFLGTTTIALPATTTIAGSLTLSGGNSTSNIASSTVETFTASTTPTGTWTKPANLKYIVVKVVGGGGGGAGENTTSAGAAPGGGGGGYCENIVPASALGSTVSYAVGGGGPGVSQATGGAGGTSSFGSWCTATGGAGGVFSGSGNAGDGGTGGTGSVGYLTLSGQQGGAGEATNNIPIGYGGASQMGKGASALRSQTVGNDGKQCGGGGSGSNESGASGAVSGGNGAVGCVIVYDYFY